MYRYPLDAPDDPPLPSPCPNSGLFLSLDHDDGVDFEMAPLLPARPAAPVNFHDTYYSNTESLSRARDTFTRLPPINTALGNSRLHTLSATSNSPTSPLPAFPSPSFNSQYLSSLLSSSSQPPPSSATQPSAPTTEELLQLLHANRLNCRTKAVNYWELQCYQCSSWISTSIDAVRQLQSLSQLKTLEQHMCSKACQREARKPASGASFSVPRSSLGSPTDYSLLSPSGSVPPWSPQFLAGSPPLSPEMDSPLLPHPSYDSQRERYVSCVYHMLTAILIQYFQA
jgi:hypothetical protein